MIHFRDIDDQGILRFVCWRAFLVISEEPDFSQTCGFRRIICIIFMGKKRYIIGLNFRETPKNPTLDKFLGLFPQTDNFSEKFGIVNFWPLTFVTSWKISEKFCEPFLRKRVHYHTDILTLGHTESGSFIRPFPSKDGSPTTIIQSHINNIGLYVFL